MNLLWHKSLISWWPNNCTFYETYNLHPHSPVRTLGILLSPKWINRIPLIIPKYEGLNTEYRKFYHAVLPNFKTNAASLIAAMKKELFDEVESRFESQLVDLRNQMLNEKRDYAESLLDLYR